jgi:hypothetical protein
VIYVNIFIAFTITVSKWSVSGEIPSEWPPAMAGGRVEGSRAVVAL